MRIVRQGANEAFVDALGARGVEVGRVYGGIRAVTHLDVSEQDIVTTLDLVAATASDLTDAVRAPECD